MVRGRVCRAANFGVFVELAPGVEGLCHRSEIPGTSEHRHDESPLPIGEEMDFKVVRLNEAEKKIGLSVRALSDDEERTQAGGLSASRRGCHHDHRRSNEHQSKGEGR